MAIYGLRIQEKRKKVIFQFNQIFGKIFEEITGIEGLKISYDSSWKEKDENGNIIGKVRLQNMDKSETILKELSVPGEHMRINALNAALVLYLMDVPAERIITILNSWQGIDHRLQYFHSYKTENNSCFIASFAFVLRPPSFGRPQRQMRARPAPLY